MFEQGRLGDLWLLSIERSGTEGVAIQGSVTVLVNGKPALRVGDVAVGVNGTERQRILSGAPFVMINGRAPGRMGDPTVHVEGKGLVVQGSGNVLIGNAPIPPAPFSLQSLLTAGAQFMFVGTSNFTLLLATMISEALPWLLCRGLPAGIFDLLGKVMPGWADLLTNLLAAACYIVWHIAPIKGKTPAEWAAWYFRNLVDNLVDGNERLPWNACPVHTSSNVVAPRYPFLGDLASLHDDLKSADKKLKLPNADPVELTDRVLRFFQPIEYQFVDDLYPISVGNILRWSTFVASGKHEEISSAGSELQVLQRWYKPGGGKESINIDDAFARGQIHRTTYPTRVYGSISLPKPENADTEPTQSIVLSYKHCRAGSYMPTQRRENIAFLHEFDGESIDIVVNVIDGTVARTRTGGHGYRFSCKTVIYKLYPGDPIDPQDTSQRLPPSRVCIFIAMGSHAIAPTPGPRIVKSGLGTTDWYPPQQNGDGVTEFLPELITEKAGEEYILAIGLADNFAER